MKKLFLSILLLAVLIGCSRFELEEPIEPSAPTLYAEIADESDSRTYLEEAKYMRWHAEDEISSFLGNTLNQRYGFDGKTGANSGTFSQVSYQLGTGNPISCIQAIYPYAASTTIDDRTGAIGYVFPKVQQHGEGDTYGPGANPMVATTSGTSDLFLYFRNVGGYLKLQLYGEDVTVTGISVKGNQQEKLSGQAFITAAYNADPQVQMTEAATEGVVLDCGEGVQLSSDKQNPTIFWIVMPPTTFEGGFTITIRGDNGKGCIKSTSRKQVIPRNNYVAMSAFSVVCDQEIDETEFEEDVPVEQVINIPNNQIWYSTTNGMAYDFTGGGTIDPKEQFGVKLLSNIYYPEGYGVMTFAGDVTKLSDIFKGNTLLTDIKLPGSILDIGLVAFQGCTSLESALLSKGITSIGGNAFQGCTSLSSITLPDGLTLIESYAFDGCTSLSSITLPSSITSIAGNTFNNCSSLKEIHGVNASSDHRCWIVDGALIIFAPAGITTYEVPEGVTSIGYSAFYGCTSLTSITLPEGVTSIYSLAFSGCTSLVSIILPSSMTEMKGRAFYNCSSLKEIYGVNASDDRRCWIVDGELMIFAPAGITTFEVPEGVTSIGTSAFYGCTSLTSITLPEGLASIDHSAFRNCTSLLSITLPKDLASIGTSAFSGCTALASISLPEGLTSIETSAFSGCTALASITLPEGLASIDHSTFKNCTSLLSITLPKDLASIGHSAFSGCTALTSITLPEGLALINHSAFQNCTSLLSITLPKDLASIGTTAFSGCTALATIRCMASNPPSIGSSVFWYIDQGAKIYVPASDDDSIINAYRTAQYWSDYADRMVEDIPSGGGEETGDGEESDW